MISFPGKTIARARATRRVTGLPETSTIEGLPSLSTCENVFLLMYLVGRTNARYKIITMVTVAEASSIVLANAFRSPETEVAIEESVGRVLAEVVSADRDLPPIDRVTMDGIAISFEAWSGGKREFS